MTMADNSIYERIHQGKRRSFDIRRVRYNVTQWGDPNAPTFFYLHGWGDSGTTFQFVVDELQDDWHVVAPDWRGFGRSVVECSSYWFPDYLADLHALLDVYSPDEPARLVGHSMGANIGGLYAGTMPERVRAFVNVEGFGLNDSEPDAAPQRYRQWLEQSQDLPTFTKYADRRALAAKILARNPQMSAAQADFVAGEWGVPRRRTVNSRYVPMRATSCLTRFCTGGLKLRPAGVQSQPIFCWCQVAPANLHAARGSIRATFGRTRKASRLPEQGTCCISRRRPSWQ